MPHNSIPNYTVITTKDEMDKFFHLWNGFNTSALPTQHYSWIEACVYTFNSTQEVSLVVYGSLDKPFAFAPLVQSKNTLRRLEVLGLKELHEPVDLICQDSQSLEGLVKVLTQLGLPFILGRLPAESTTIGAFIKGFSRKGLCVCRESIGYPSIQLTESWLLPEQNLSTQRASDLRRGIRKAEKVGPVTTEIISPQLNELDYLLDQIFTIEANSWKGKMKTAVIQNVDLGTFFRRYAELACQSGILRICLLRIGGTIAAMQFAVEYNNQFWLMKIGYDEQFGFCSPGNLLLRDSIKYAAEHGNTKYNFLGVIEPWTLNWTKSESSCVSLRYYPYSLPGIKAMVVDFSWSLYQKVKKRMQRRKK